MSTILVRALVGALLLGPLAIGSPAEAATGSLPYECTNTGGADPSYPFQVTIDSDLPAALPYGSTRTTTWTAQVEAPDSYRDWAADQGFALFGGGPHVAMALDGVEAPIQYLGSTTTLVVPTASGPWIWHATSFPYSDTTTSATTLGHHTLAVDGLELGTYYYDADGNPRLGTTMICSLDPSTPAADTVIDSYDVVAATTATALSIAGSTATATVTSNGAAPAGSVTFTVGTRSVSVPVAAGKATTKLPVVKPGGYAVSATFVPSQPTQQVGSVGTAAYTAPLFASTSSAAAKYRSAKDLIKARAHVVGADGTAATGRVTFVLKRNGVTLDNVTVGLPAGKTAKSTFRGITKAGKYLVIAKYLGSATYRRSQDRVRFTV